MCLAKGFQNLRPLPEGWWTPLIHPALVPKRHRSFSAWLFLSDGSAKMLPKTGAFDARSYSD